MEIPMPPRSVTLREILKQPRLWKQTVEQYNKQPTIAQTLGDMADIDEVIFTSCGSGQLTAETVAYWWQALTEVPARAVPASELLYHMTSYVAPGLNFLVFALSRSGATELTQVAAEAALSETPGHSVAVTCTPDSPLTRRTNHNVVLKWAADRSSAPTGSLTCMTVLLTYAAAMIGGRRDLTDDLELLPAATDEMIESHGEAIQQLAADNGVSRVDILGSGPLHGVAREAAMKIKQMSGVPAEGLLPLEYFRGHRQCADQNTLVVVLEPYDPPPYQQQLLDVLAVDLGLKVLRIGWPEGRKSRKVSAKDNVTQWPLIGVESDLAGGLQALVMLQLLACHAAVARGRNPDGLPLPPAVEKFKLLRERPKG
jgi:glucosamine--fructose-6-phosphate aminotransferase (isomerizing)